MKNVFNFKIYKEFLKQTKVIGILMSIITCFLGSLIPISTYMNIINSQEEYVRRTAVLSDIVFIYYITFILTVPMLTFTAFHFLTKRNTCDFYHSIPHKRICLFTSIFGAVITWIFINIASTTLVFTILYTLFKKYIIFNIGPLLICSINVFIISLLVCSAIVLACTITGNSLNNIFVGGIILFLPRVFIIIFTTLIESSIPFFDNLDTILLLKRNTNLLFGALGYNDYTIFNTLNFGTFYTLILSIIYIGLAAYVFKIRKSEVAGNSSISPILQIIFRISTGLFITLPSVIMIFTYLTNPNEVESISMLVFYVIVNILISIIFMFVYELISTKRVKNAIRSLLYTPIHLVAFAATIIIVYSIFNISLNYVPSKDSIDYIHLYAENDDYDYDNLSNYFETKIINTKIDDKEIINKFINTLESDIEKFKENPSCINNMSSIHITFVCGNKEYDRLVYFSRQEYSSITEKLSKAIELNNIFLDLPDPAKSQVRIEGMYGDTNFDKNYTFANELYKTLIDNIKNNPDPYISYMRSNFYCDKLDLSFNNEANNENEYPFYYNLSLRINTTLNGKTVYEDIPVITDYSEIAKMIFNINMANSELRSYIKDTSNNVNEYIYKYDELNIAIYPMCKLQTNEFINFYYSNASDYYSYYYGENDCTPLELEKMKSELEVASDEDIKKFKYLADNIDNEYSENAYLYSIEVYYENTYAPFEAYKNISQTILIALPEPIEFESTTHISN